MKNFDCTVPSNINDTLDKLQNTIENLIEVNKDLFDQNNEQAYELTLFLNKVLCDEKFYEANTNWSFLFEDDSIFSKLIISIWSQLSKLHSQFTFDSNLVIQKDIPNKQAGKNERNLSIFRYINEITFVLTKNQYANEEMVKFNQKLIKAKLVNKLIRFFDDSNSDNYELTQIAGIIRNISKNTWFMGKQMWVNLDVEARLKNSIKMNNEAFKKIVDGFVLRINQKNVKETLVYLIQLKDSQIIIEDKQAYIDFFYLKSILKKLIFTEFSLFSDYNVIDLFCNMLLKFYEIKNELNFESYVEKIDDVNADEPDLNLRKISILDCLLFTINKCAFKSINLGLYLNNKRLIKILCDFAQCDEFISKSLVSIKNTIFSNITVLVLYSDENKQEWLDTCPISLLLKLIDKYAANTYISRQINIIIGYLANEKEIDDLKQIQNYLSVLINHLQEIANKLDKNEPLKKIKCEYLTETKKMVTHNTYSSYFNGMLTGSLNLLMRFAVNQNEKKKIFSSCLNSIEIIIYKGNDLEKYFALKLLAQICFDGANSKEISKNTQLVDFINTLFTKCKTNKNTDNIANLDDELAFVCQNIIWIIKQNENLIANEEKNPINPKNYSNREKHIMISYSWSTQKECLQIKKALETLNHKTWMDVDQMHGSTMDAMADAIENSYCVLICVSEKYRLSENCQLEAKYVMKKKKPFIPLIMQEGSENVDGWLGFMLSDKLFINFKSKRYNFDNCIQLLEAEIQKLISPNQIKKEIPIYSEHIIEQKIEQKTEKKIDDLIDKNNVESWDSDQLRKWLIANNIHQEIVDSFEKLDGACLKQLYQLNLENPQFVYQTLINEANNKLKLANVLLFMTRVKKLFHK